MKWVAGMALAALVISLGLAGYTIVQAERQMTYFQEALKERDKAIEAALLHQGESLRQELAESLAKSTPPSSGIASQSISVAPSYQVPRSQSVPVFDYAQYQQEQQAEQQARREKEELERKMQEQERRVREQERRVRELEEQARQLERCKKFGVGVYC